MKKTANETRIESEFFKVWDSEFKCDDCEFSRLYAKTRDIFCVREERYVSILEKIAQTVNPGNGMCGKLYDDLPEMLLDWLDTRGDKAKLVSENKALKKENAEMALEIHRLKS